MLDDNYRGSFVYSFAEKIWERVEADMPFPREKAAVAVIEEAVFLVGGCGADPVARNFNRFVNLRKMLKFNSRSESWQEMASMTSNRLSAAATVLERSDGSRSVVVSGGQTQYGTILSSCEEYDLRRDEWLPFPMMEQARSGHCLVATDDGALFAIGGQWNTMGDRSSRLLNTIEKWDSEKNKWSLLPMEMPYAVAFCGAVYM